MRDKSNKNKENKKTQLFFFAEKTTVQPLRKREEKIKKKNIFGQKQG